MVVCNSMCNKQCPEKSDSIAIANLLVWIMLNCLQAFQWLLSWLPHKWRESYLLPAWAQKITCRCFNWILQSSSGQNWSVNKFCYMYYWGYTSLEVKGWWELLQQWGNNLKLVTDNLLFIYAYKPFLEPWWATLAAIIPLVVITCISEC